MRIDVHAHYWTEDYIDRLVDLGLAGAVMARGLGAGDGAELEARLRLMDRAGVELQVLSACPQLPYSEDGPKAAAVARFVNDQYAELVQRRRGRFSAFAALPLPHADEALGEMGRALDDLRMVGVAKTETRSSARSTTSTTPRSSQTPPAPSSTRTPAPCSASERLVCRV